MSFTAKDSGYVGIGNTQLELKDFRIEYTPRAPETCSHPTICLEQDILHFEDVYYCPHCRLKIGIPRTNHLKGSSEQARENILGILGLAFGEEVKERLRGIGR